jgi:hypothetical protein
MTSPFVDLNTAIQSKLTGSTALTTVLGGTAIYHLQAPKNVSYPYVIWSYQMSGPENINPSPLHTSVIFIRCYDTNAARAGTIDGLIDTAITSGTLTLSNSWANYWTAREEDFFIIDNPPSEAPIYMAGAFYKINLDK